MISKDTIDMVKMRVQTLEGQCDALAQENDLFRLVIKHVIRSQGQVIMRVADFKAVEDEPGLDIIEDEVNDRMIIKIKGDPDLVIA